MSKKATNELHSSKLYQLVVSLHPKERLRLRAFLSSPYWGTDLHLHSLFILLEQAIQKKESLLSRESIHAKVFPNSAYSDLRMRKLMSKLLGQIEMFLVVEDFRAKEAERLLATARIYRERKLSKHFKYTLRQLKNTVSNDHFRDAEFHQKGFEITFEEYLFRHERQQVNLQQLQDVSNALDSSYCCLKLKQTCYMISRQAVFNQDYDFGMLSLVLSYVEQKPLLHLPAISIYYYAYQSFRNPEDESLFERLKKETTTHAKLFPPKEAHDLYLLAINYCIRKLNRGNIDYLYHGLDLYKDGLKTGHLLINDQLNRATYINIVAMGLKSKDYPWVHQFIHQYREQLPKQVRESTYRFCLARYEYDQKNYDRVLELINQMDYPDILTGLVAKTLSLKVYYEKGEDKLLEAHLDAMDIYLRRKKVIGYHKNNYRSIIKLTRKLIRVNPYDREAVARLRSEIESTAGITEKTWLQHRALAL